MDSDVRAPLPDLDVLLGTDELHARAAALSGMDNCAVVDVGGTTTDVG